MFSGARILNSTLDEGTSTVMNLTVRRHAPDVQFDHQSQPTLVQMEYVPPDHATVAPLVNWDLLSEQDNAASAVQAES